MSEKREQVYQFIVDYKAASGGASPTVRQITKALELSSTSIVQYHITALIEEGRIVRDGYHLSIPGERWTLEAEAA